jgi:hypothetical protein
MVGMGAHGENFLSNDRDDDDWRTIPTHVGRTYNKPTGTFHYPDHPHARGENTTRATCAFDNLTWPTCAHLIWPTLR